MKKFAKHDGLVIPFDRTNVDTDAIIPKQFLTSIKRTGFGQNLFDEWRYLDHGKPGDDCSTRVTNKFFELNLPQYVGGTILLTRENFGCGSSREHAVWALQEFGFRVILAPSFGDIFFSNSLKNGLLTIVLSCDVIEQMFTATKEKVCRLTVDLVDQSIKGECLNAPVKFSIDPFRKRSLVEGIDEIGMTLEKADQIKAFEHKHKNAFPWLSAPLY